jgi:benzoyl-CoA reductase/2-hydroxyglutaryl-CoA dehydratase subunit BcrC/BadD/HgdB
MQVYFSSPWIPAEWIAAHGLEPRGVWGAGELRLDAGPVSEGICPFADATRRMAMAEAEGVVVFSTACDQMRRSHDALPEEVRCRSFLFNLPATWQSSTAEGMYRVELERLGRFLCSLGGHSPDAGMLQQEMARRRRVRSELLKSATTSSALAFARAVAQFHWDGTAEFPREAPAPPNGVPIALVGGPLGRPHWHLLDDIESAGGRVVLNATEAGEGSLWADLEERAPGEAPFDHMARAYFSNRVDVSQRPNSRLYDWLQPRLRSRGARGIVLRVHTGCDLWRAEAQTLREGCGLPVILLEAEEARQSSPRTLTRIGAFLESLQ